MMPTTSIRVIPRHKEGKGRTKSNDTEKDHKDRHHRNNVFAVSVQVGDVDDEITSRETVTETDQPYSSVKTTMRSSMLVGVVYGEDGLCVNFENRNIDFSLGDFFLFSKGR